MHKKWTDRVELTKKYSHFKSRVFLRKRRLTTGNGPSRRPANVQKKKLTMPENTRKHTDKTRKAFFLTENIKKNFQTETFYEVFS